MQSGKAGTGSDAEDRAQQVAMDCLQLLSLLEVVSKHEPADLAQLMDAGRAATQLLQELPALAWSAPRDTHRRTVARLLDAQSKAQALQQAATLKARTRLSSHVRFATFAEEASQLALACEQLRLWIEERDSATEDSASAAAAASAAASTALVRSSQAQTETRQADAQLAQ